MRPFHVFLGVLVLPAFAVATTIVPHTLLQRAEQSDRVALVQVLSQRVEESPGAQIPLKTFTRVVIGSNWKGKGPEQLTIVQIGGRSGPLSVEIPGDAKFKVGETAVVFLRCRLAPDRCHLVAMGAGKLDVSGEDALVQDLENGSWSKRSLSSLQAELSGGAR